MVERRSKLCHLLATVDSHTHVKLSGRKLFSGTAYFLLGGYNAFAYHVDRNKCRKHYPDDTENDRAYDYREKA